MSKPATVRFFVKRFRTKKQQQLLALLNDKDIKVQANTIIKDAINEFVPMKSGALRASADVTPESISWGKGLKIRRLSISWCCIWTKSSRFRRWIACMAIS